MELMEKFPGKVESFYNTEISEDKEETLETITLKRNILKKGGIADMERMARTILKDWQTGKIK